ncbi:P-loop containing nucleoside triphosphate hydrolase protein [Lichtheimia hyalospora FSU 10163]|nr:P-loop containing nucleoside triphosphate hydrolase protein [Lichtheimia hyalospora FSU 10163]
MPRKKKAASNRGFATVSTPKPNSTQPTPPPPPPPPSDNVDIPSSQAEITKTHSPSPPTTKQENPDDNITRLVKRFANVNDRKAETLLNELGSRGVNEEQGTAGMRSFALTADVEFDLLQVLKHQGKADTFGTAGHPSKKRIIQHPLDYDRAIGHMDVVYRTLLKMGFHADDVMEAFGATASSDIHHLLDWLCVHVPYDRMPVGFFDKYFTEEGLSIRAELPEGEVHEGNKERRMVEEPKDVVTLDRSNDDAAIQEEEDVKAKILKAAQQYYEEEEEDDDEQHINEKHATLRLELSQLEEQLPKNNSKKKKKFTSTMDTVDVQAVEKKIAHVRQSMQNIENDWDFDKRKAQEIFVTMQREALEALKESRERRKQQELKEKQQAAKEEKASAQQQDDPLDLGLGGDGDDDEDGGLFGNMLDQEEEQQTTSTPAESEENKVSWQLVDLAKPGWIGRYPKDMLQEFCKQNTEYSKQVYTTTNLGGRQWRAKVKLVSRQPFHEPRIVEIPGHLITNNTKDAEQLVAMAALFELDPASSIYRIMSTPFKDLWLQWVEEKNERELRPQLEESKKRMQLFVDLMDGTLNKHNEDIVSESASGHQAANVEDDGKGSKKPVHVDRNAVFARVKNTFAKRIRSKDYIDMKKKRNELPMSSYREQVLSLVRDNQIIIVSGETGCGKSTQVPQFLAEELLQGNHNYGSVICTQPRRISAMSIAKRVSTEMGDYPRSIGTKNGLVGYQIRLESKVANENVLVFCTTGILLRRLESDPHLEGVTHVVVDEVHERTLDSDFLLIVLRRLCQIRHDLKIILMSATVEAHRFSEYFGGCPAISVPGRTFPVKVQYLEDVVEATGYTIEEDSHYAVRRERIHKAQGSVQVSGGHGTSHKVHFDWYDNDYDDDDPYDMTRLDGKLTIKDEDNQDETPPKYSEQTRKMIKRMDESKINYDLILDLLDYICIRSQDEHNHSVPDTGAILVFLPGMPEIRRLYDMVAAHHILGDASKYILIALHSTLSSEHQERAFDVPPKGMRKIVFSTNIAETGVTISDVTVVIDTGMAKIVSYDQKRRITRLRQSFIAKANARQRRGRAGRVQEGLCFHLFTENKYMQMADYETPEILRLPLEELCLRIKVCELGSIQEFLGTALDAPSPQLVVNAIETLQEVQALSTDGLETLTALGAHLANLPVDVHIGKMILFGAIFRCLDPVLTIAAALSFKSPFMRPFGREVEADVARSKFRYADSDFWTIVKAYQAWRDQLQKLQGQGSGWRRKIRDFCGRHFLSEANLEMMEDMKRQYLELLLDIGFVKSNDIEDLQGYQIKRGGKMRWCSVPPIYNEHATSVPVVNAATMAGLYPKLAERHGETFANDKHTAMRIHPSSMLFGRETSLSSDFLVYNTVVMNGEQIYMWEATTIEPVAVMLLASDMEIKHKQRTVILDEWIKFECFARSAALLKFLRMELTKWLTIKMKQPSLDLTNYSQEMMDVMVRTLESRLE